MNKYIYKSTCILFPHNDVQLFTRFRQIYTSSTIIPTSGKLAEKPELIFELIHPAKSFGGKKLGGGGLSTPVSRLKKEKKKKKKEKREIRLTRSAREGWPSVSVQVAPGGWVAGSRTQKTGTLVRQIRAGNPERQGGLAYPPGNGSGEGGRKKGGIVRAAARTGTGRKHTPRRGSLASVTPLRSRVANNAG